MDLSECSADQREQERVADLMRLLPEHIESALDVGAGDGFISKLLAERCSRVTSLDLERPAIDHERIHSVKGDAAGLDFADDSFDLVVCTEVLEHLPTAVLDRACRELSRVSNRHVLVGVPYKQDIRVGRTTCQACGQTNPPWGHLNTFDEGRLRTLFPSCAIAARSFVGVAGTATNWLSCALMDMAGNPYGTYSQREPCAHCGATLKRPAERTWLKKALTRAAHYARQAQAPFLGQHPNWIHVLLEKRRM